MILVLSGDNDFMRHQETHYLRREFAAEHGSSAVQVCDATTLAPHVTHQLFQGVSLFDPVRMVVLRGAQQNKPFWDILPDALSTHDTITVVIDEARPDKRTRTYKWLQRHADWQDFPVLNDSQLAAWVRAEADIRGIELGASLATQLVMRAGLDQWMLTQALDKLALSDQPVTTELITTLIDDQPHNTAFDLLDAALAGRADRVGKLVATLKHTEDPYRLAGLVASQVYSLALAQTAGDRSTATLARDAGLHPFVAGKMLAVAKTLSKAQLSRVIDTVVILDQVLKSTGGDPWLPLESTLMGVARR